MQRNAYDTSLKHLVRLDCTGAVPAYLLKSVPRSCLYRWKNEPNHKYTGSELNSIAKEKLELIRQFACDTKAQRVFLAYGKIMLTFSQLTKSFRNFNKHLREEKEKVVNTILQVAKTISVEKAIKVFGISRATFQSWLVQVKFKCENSVFSLCRKHYPNQLQPTEVETMKRILNDPDLKHWPIVSLCYYAIRKNLLSASPATWYKYNKLLGIRKHAFKRRNPYKKGLKATRPNEYWHADITIFKTLDNIKHYIYLVVDNYSRKILSWEMADKVSGEIRMQTLKEAWEMAEPKKEVELVVDGGPENNNYVVENFINSAGVDITKSVALKDILFSNSMVEAANKLLKYRYLFPKGVQDGEQLRNVLEKSIADFNNIRPHGKLGGLTPSEAYQGQNVPISFDSQALRHRIDQNHNNTGCVKCEN